MGQLATLDSTGDTKVIWDADNPAEVETARETFEKLTKKGFRAFSVKKNGEQDELITKFDPSLEKIILVPMQKGG